MQGAGNDYVYINGFTEKIAQEEKPEWVRKVSDRHFGIGSDGAIFINPSDVADFEMEMYNADGTRSEMCGNGIRCVGKYVYDKGLTDKTQFTVVSAGKIKVLDLTVENGKATLIKVNMGEPILEAKQVPVVSAGKVKYLDLTIENGKAVQIKVNMGEPILKAKQVPVVSDSEEVIDELIYISEVDESYNMTCVSMGNPHAVVFMDDVENLQIEKIGPYFENHCRFPNRTNTEFVKVIDRNNVQMRVWERGTGETLACGTGCCATAVACILNGLTDEEVTVHVLGGKIKIFWDRENNLVYMTGPAETVFEGEIE